MPDMFAEVDAVAFELPGAAVLRSEVVFIGILAFLKTAGERPCFLVRGFCCVVCRSQADGTRKHEQRNDPRHDLEIHHQPPRIESYPYRSMIRLADNGAA